MAHTMTLRTLITEERSVRVQLPPDVPVGEADMFVVVVPMHEDGRRSGRDLLESELFGMWADRTDIEDSAEYARRLRHEAWTRTAP
jgi:hypothetical protein